MPERYFLFAITVVAVFTATMAGLHLFRNGRPRLRIKATPEAAELKKRRVPPVSVLQRRKHKAALLSSFPEALDLLLICVESGLGLDAAFTRVARELKGAHSAMTQELDRTRFELAMRGDRVQALENLANRTALMPFQALVSALVQSEKFGTGLADTLRTLADDLRATRLLATENKAARLPVLITIPLIFCILPAFIMIVLGPMLLTMSHGSMFAGR